MMRPTHSVLIDADAARFRLRRIFELLREMGLLCCADCGVWKADEHYAVVGVHGYTVKRADHCVTCDDAGDGEPVALGARR